VKPSLSLGAETIGDEMNPSFPFDYHVHESHSRDAPDATLQAIIHEAEKRGIREIALTSHLIVSGPDVYLSVQMDELDEYFQGIWEAQEDTDVVLRAGLEVDYFPGEEKRLEKIIDEHPLDYCLGSIHYLNGVDIGSRMDARNFFKGRPLHEAADEYFTVWRMAAESGLFDVLAHPDYWRKHLETVRSEPATFEDYGSVYRDALHVLANEGVGLEVNTSSDKVGLMEFYPVQGFLEEAYESGVPTVTVGSDAHTPSALGHRLDEAASNLRRAGFESISTFEGRRNQARRIDDLNPSG
jgi:histidinol-phosphatase (PHP family)